MMCFSIWLLKLSVKFPWEDSFLFLDIFKVWHLKPFENILKALPSYKQKHLKIYEYFSQGKKILARNANNHFSLAGYRPQLCSPFQLASWPTPPCVGYCNTKEILRNINIGTICLGFILLWNRTTATNYNLWLCLALGNEWSDLDLTLETLKHWTHWKCQFRIKTFRDNCENENQEHDNISNGWLAHLQLWRGRKKCPKNVNDKMMTTTVPIPLLGFSLVFKFVVASKTEHENNLHLVKKWL